MSWSHERVVWVGPPLPPTGPDAVRPVAHAVARDRVKRAPVGRVIARGSRPPRSPRVRFVTLIFREPSRNPSEPARPRPRKSVPKIRPHSSRQARVTIHGTDYLLGPFGSPEPPPTPRSPSPRSSPATGSTRR